MKDFKIEVIRILIFLSLIILVIYEFLSYISLVDYIGQYIIEYDPEYYLIEILGLSTLSMIINYIFTQMQKKNTVDELIYLQILAVIYLVLIGSVMLFGIWLFRDYKYDYLVYWGTVIINSFNFIINIENIRRNRRHTRTTQPHRGRT